MLDIHDEADFYILDTQAVLERFMSNMSKLADYEYLHYLSSSTVICNTYKMHIQCIPKKFRLYTQNIQIAYTCYVYDMYIICIYQ